jgi:predicted porin
LRAAAYVAPLAAAAIGTLTTGAASAQVQLYGTIDLGVGQIETQPPGPPNAAIVLARGVHSGAMQTSYIGLRGSEDLGGGLRARFQIESFMRADIGQPGRFDASPTSSPDPFWSRESYVALGNELGEIRLGSNAHPTWIAMIQTSALGSNSVFSPGFRQLFNGGTRGRSEVDTAMVNSVKLQSAAFAGFSGNVTVQAGEGSGSGANYSAQVGWRNGPLYITAAMSTIRHAAVPNLPGAREQDIALVGASYDFGVAKVFGQYTTIDNARLGSDDKVPHVGFTVPLGAGTIQFARAEDRNRTAVGTATVTTRRTTTSAGYVHGLSKRTELYAFVMQDKVATGVADSQVVGIRHTF